MAPIATSPRAVRHYIARKTGNHYKGHHNCIIETVSDTGTNWYSPFVQTYFQLTLG
jgi:hypothetical protein